MSYKIHKSVRHFSLLLLFILAGCEGNQVPEITNTKLPADCVSASDSQIVCLTTFGAIYSNLTGYDTRTVILNGYLVIDQGVLSFYSSREAYEHKMTEGNVIILRASSGVQKDIFDKFGYSFVRVSGKFHASELPPLSRYELGAIKEDLVISELPNRSSTAAHEQWSDIRIHADDLSDP